MAKSKDDEDTDHDRALWLQVATDVLAQPLPERRIEVLLTYLEAFPTGRFNRHAAEAIEAALRRVKDPTKQASLRACLRSVRDPYLPPVEPDTWSGD